ncbi:MAG: hypothetical protein J0I48_15060 [Devosia sp.]|uniref:hypothetical protein n=1 Tax=Devosia sp. 66-22 TaxID=1895753 RepID=UPI0009269092|nr:hypothetical protein [Devosia sp. 66-22]MBN9347491.1 hypothetical protein [Devosia sp.]OJX53645.1 MAG: hypothetical protein BGO81_13850 [Devosia sp. 66-22]
MFSKGFGRYVVEGDAIACEVDGFTVTATLYRDDCGDRPDERQDGFWPSLDPQSAGYIGPKSKRTLARHWAKAKRVMDAWLADEWHYYGVSLTVEREDVKLVHRYEVALWGIEGNYPDDDNAYLGEVANELLDEALGMARERISRLCAA